MITGAAFGIGRATAELFAREGARLTATDIQGEPLLALADELQRGGAEIETVVGDVSVEADARRMIGAAVDRFGRLDVLVANAGIIPLGDATEVTAADWDDVMAIDGRGMFLTCKFAIEAMAADRRWRHRLPFLDLRTGRAEAAGGLRTAKFVATGLTKHLAVEWADRGIRVNAVAPGTIRTERVMRFPEEPGGSEYLAAIERMHPMGRIGESAEVASAIVFLASDDASFITGAVLPVDGGFLAQ